MMMIRKVTVLINDHDESDGDNHDEKDNYHNNHDHENLDEAVDCSGFVPKGPD